MYINWHWRAFTQQKTLRSLQIFRGKACKQYHHCAWWMDSALLYSCDVFQACLCVHECDAFKPMICIASFKCSRSATCIHRLEVNTTLCKKSLQAVLLYGSPYATTARPHRIYIGVPTLQLPLQPKDAKGTDKESMQPPLQLQIFNFFTCGNKAQLEHLASSTLPGGIKDTSCSSKSTLSDRFVAHFTPCRQAAIFRLAKVSPKQLKISAENWFQLRSSSATWDPFVKILGATRQDSSITWCAHAHIYLYII